MTKRLVFQASFRFHALSDSDTKTPDLRTILKNADMMVVVSLNATSSLPATPGAVQPVDLSWDPQYQNPLRRLAFYVVLVFVFLRFSTLQEIVAAKTGQQLYLLYLLVPLGWLGYLTTGGLQRTFLRRGALFWVAFAAWMVIDIPFSEWRGNCRVCPELFQNRFADGFVCGRPRDGLEGMPAGSLCDCRRLSFKCGGRPLADARRLSCFNGLCRHNCKFQ